MSDLTLLLADVFRDGHARAVVEFMVAALVEDPLRVGHPFNGAGCRHYCTS